MFRALGSVSCPSSSFTDTKKPETADHRNCITYRTRREAPAVRIEIAPCVSRSITHRCIRTVSFHCNTARDSPSLQLNGEREREEETFVISMSVFIHRRNIGYFEITPRHSSECHVFAYASPSIALIKSRLPDS